MNNKLKLEERRLLKFLSISEIGITKVFTRMNNQGCKVIITRHGKKKTIQMSRDQTLQFAEYQNSKDIDKELKL